MTISKEDGVWKIQRLNYMMQWQADYEGGLGEDPAHLQPAMATYPEDPIRSRPHPVGGQLSPDLAASPGSVDELCASVLGQKFSGRRSSPSS